MTDGQQISAVERWQLILGQPPRSPDARRLARSLEELYGHGTGEGSGESVGRGGVGPRGGGLDGASLGVREWSGELDLLFGSTIREEVLAQAAAAGQVDAALELDPGEVVASVELLEQLLALRGGLPEAKLVRLRRLVAHVVDQLSRRLTRQLRPALVGAPSPRVSVRGTGPLDLRRTIAANLAHLRVPEDGQGPVLVPEKLLFRSRSTRSLDWRVVVVVDTSGSMEPSTIYAALVASVLAGIPALSVHFVTFSTVVVDLTGRVDDPLALLLEIEVGGGTDIAQALRYARTLVTVPARTLVVVLSDFEEGRSVRALLSEVRQLVAGGSRLLGLAALDDRGNPRYDTTVAGLVAGAGMPVAALTPLELAAWVGEQVR